MVCSSEGVLATGSAGAGAIGEGVRAAALNAAIPSAPETMRGVGAGVSGSPGSGSSFGAELTGEPGVPGKLLVLMRADGGGANLSLRVSAVVLGSSIRLLGTGMVAR